ncbi:4Fe-4S dicluster domain-containing protein [Candidatus Woesearchaeota archaeon]|nr:4Fe-4S dicluster domain-containing protein [Candidatus Woesearchaeota archaeon]
MPEYLKNTAQIKFNRNLCNGCGICTQVCPHQIIKLKDKKTVIENKNKCMECGACSRNCPKKAIEVKKGVGCAAAVIAGWIRNSEPACGCSSNKKCC